MKKVLLLKSTSLLVVLFAAVALFFTSANTEEAANQQGIAALSAELSELKTEIRTLKAEAPNDFDQFEGFLGEMRMFGGNFPPRAWAFCNGQLLDIPSHEALFSILGTTYGGDGRTTFGLPDLRGRVAVHAGHSAGPGLEEIRLGAKRGSEQISVQTVKGAGTGSVDVISRIGSSNHQPYQGVNFIICVEGAYPSRS